MPFIKTYEPSVSPSVSAPMRRAEAVAADGGLSALGAGIASLEQAIERRQIEQDDTDAVTAAAELKAKLAERRKQAALDGKAAEPDWLEQERDFAQAEWETTLGNLRTDTGRQRAKQRQAVLLSEETNRWIATQSSTAAGLQKNKLQNVEDVTLRAIQQDPSGRALAVENFLDDLDGPAYAQLSKDVKDDYARQFRYKAARAFLDGTEQAHGSAAALAVLDTVREEMPAEQYTSLRDHFTNRSKQEDAQEREAEQYKLFQTIDAMIESGGDPRKLITAAVEDKLLSAEQAFSQHERWQKEVELRQKIANADAAFRLGDLVSFSGVEPSIRKTVADRWVAEQMQAYAAGDPDQQRFIANQIVKKGVQMDYTFTGVQTSLRANPQGAGFTQAVDLYRSLEAFDPYYASKYVSEDQRARFDVYSNAVLGGATEETALELARGITPEAIAKTRKLFGSEEGRTTRDALKAALSDKPYWFTGEMINGHQAANAVMERAAVMLAANPSADIESVVESARVAYESQNVRMGNLWVPRAFMSGVPADRMADIAGSVTARLPDVLRANNLPVVDGNYVLAPDATSARDSRLQVYDPTGFPVPGLRFGPEDFKAEYRALQGKEYENAKVKSGGVSPEEYKRRTGFYPPGYKTGGAIGDPK